MLRKIPSTSPVVNDGISWMVEDCLNVCEFRRLPRNDIIHNMAIVDMYLEGDEGRCEGNSKSKTVSYSWWEVVCGGVKMRMQLAELPGGINAL